MSDDHLFERERAFLEKMESVVHASGDESAPLGRELKSLISKYRRLLGQTEKLVTLGDRMQMELNSLNRNLAASEEKYRNIFECAAEGIFQATPDGRLLSANPALAKILGCPTPEELLAHEPCILFSEGRLATLIEEMSGDNTAQHTFELKLDTGAKAWLEMRAKAVRNEDGQIIRIDGLAGDVTKRKELELKLYHHATVDALTGLNNRRHYFEIVEIETARSARHNTPLSIMLLDIDHFKKINDTYGHDVGDVVLKRFAETVRANLRCDDVVGRIGGEEFSVLMPLVGIEGAAIAAENLREAVEDAKVKTGPHEIAFTVSIGLTTRCPDCPDMPTMFKTADDALYKAKREGRNRVAKSA